MPFRWITADEHFGEIPAFLDGIAATGKWYRVEVPVTTRVWLRTPLVQPPGPGLMGRPRLHPRVAPSAPRPLELQALATQLPRSAWQRCTIKEGSRGPLEADFAFVRVTAVRDSLPGPRQWATFRRPLANPTEVKCYLSNAPAHCPHTELVRVTGQRWPIETAFEEGKGEVGQDHYETRSWLGWHHHMLQSFQAHLFLMRLRLAFKKSPALTTAQARQLIARAIEQHSDHLLDLGAVIHYRQRRNYAAYCSHRQRTLQRHRHKRQKR